MLNILELTDTEVICIAIFNLRQGNAFAAITVIVLITLLFIGFWIIMPVYNSIHTIFHDDSALEDITTQEDCSRRGGYWEDDSCSHLSNKARTVINQQRVAWLATPFIFTASLVIWFLTKLFKRDTQQFPGGPPQ